MMKTDKIQSDSPKNEPPAPDRPVIASVTELRAVRKPATRHTVHESATRRAHRQRMKAFLATARTAI